MSDDLALFRALQEAEDDAYSLGDGYVHITRDIHNRMTYNRIDPSTVVIGAPPRSEDDKNAHSHGAKNV